MLSTAPGNEVLDIDGRDALPMRDQILLGAARCVARWGFRKTTVPDIAREAGVSRATVYRYFPDGKESVFLAAGLWEQGRLFAELHPLLEAQTDLNSTVATAVSQALRWLRGNEMLTYLVEHEPEQLAPYLAFDAIGPVLYRATSFLLPHLLPYLDESSALEVCEWAVRVVLAYWLTPSTHLDPAFDADVQFLVDRLLAVDLTNP